MPPRDFFKWERSTNSLFSCLPKQHSNSCSQWDNKLRQLHVQGAGTKSQYLLSRQPKHIHQRHQFVLQGTWHKLIEKGVWLPSIIICKGKHLNGLPFCPAFTIYVNEMYLTFLQTAKLFNNIYTYEIAEKTPKTQFEGNMTKSAVIRYESWSESVWQSPSSRIAMASCQDYPLTSSAAPK